MPSVEQVESVVCEAVTEMPAEKKAKIENGKSADFSSEVISDVTSDVTSDSTSDVTRDVTSEKPGKNGVTSMDVGSNATAESSDASTDSSDVPESLAVSAEPLSATSDKIIRQVLRFAKLSEHAKAPTRGSVDAAGYDLYAAEEKVIEPGKRACVKTDIQIEVPSGTYGRVAPRSGLAAKHGMDVGAGVIDKDYRGNVMVLLFNFGDAAFNVHPGDRIAQLVLEKISMAELEELPTLDETDRGDGGFGSTGKA